MYKNLLDEMQLFCDHGVETGSIGESELHQRIPYVFVGQKNGNYMIVQGAMHAREHLTALVTVCLAKYLVANPNLQLNGGIYFIPMTNPDGVRLCQEGIGWIDDPKRRRRLLDLNGGSKDFSLWKANADGVDINVNFDAMWGQGAQNTFLPAPQNYVGTEPCSAKETQALVEFTNIINPCVTLSYHLKGEEIYWQFAQDDERLKRDKYYAELIGKYTGYKVTEPQGSVGGYKDWCVEHLRIPAYTVEVGSDEYSHPYPYNQLSQIVGKNRDLPRRLLNTVIRDKKQSSTATIYDESLD
ncbi:MAG: hypothetical protein K2M64_02015 [Clostridia bacterium]|nr:hypothetical protein [Clostridia bacterium]